MLVLSSLSIILHWADRNSSTVQSLLVLLLLLLLLLRRSSINIGGETGGAGRAIAPNKIIVWEQLVHPAPSPIFSVTFS